MTRRKAVFFNGKMAKKNQSIHTTKTLPHPKGPAPTKAALYHMAGKHAKRAIEVLAELMESADNDSVKQAAARTLLAKTIPDQTVQEFKGAIATPATINITLYGKQDQLYSFLSNQLQPFFTQPPGATSAQPSSAFSSTQLAPQGPQDNAGDKPVN